jgi:hypothetical protein
MSLSPSSLRIRLGPARCLTPIIPVTQEAEIREFPSGAPVRVGTDILGSTIRWASTLRPPHCSLHAEELGKAEDVGG